MRNRHVHPTIRAALGSIAPEVEPYPVGAEVEFRNLGRYPGQWEGGWTVAGVSYLGAEPRYLIQRPYQGAVAQHSHVARHDLRRPAC